MRKNHSNWREDLREVVDIESSKPETEAKSEVRVGDKKVDNKITINPVMKEAFGEIGALVIEVTELEEEECDDKEKKKRDIENLQNDKDTKEGRKPGKLKEDLGMLQQQRAKREVQTAKIDMKIARERTKTAKDAKTSVQDQEAQQVKEVLDMKKADMGEVITDFRKTDAPQFKGKSDKKIQKMAIAAKLNAEETEDGLRDRRMERGGVDGNKKQQMAIAAKLESEKGPQNEEMSVKDQMKVSAEYWKKNPRKPYKPGDGYARNVRDAARNAARQPKDTRTDSQRMADATGPRKGSNYRGD